MGPPYGECRDSKPDWYLFDRDYSLDGCWNSFVQHAVVDACGCYDPLYPPPSVAVNASADDNSTASVAPCRAPDDGEARGAAADSESRRAFSRLLVGCNREHDARHKQRRVRGGVQRRRLHAHDVERPLAERLIADDRQL